MSLYLDLLRHGETVSGGGFRGRLDDELTAEGWRQMRQAIADRGPWQRIVSSPLKRCARFAAELAERQGLQLELEPAFRELDFGEWEGRTAAELSVDHSDELGRFWSDPYGFTPPGGEPLAGFEARIFAALDRLAHRCAGERVLLVTHGGVMRLLLAEARGLPRRHLLQVEVGHGELFGLLAETRDARLWLETTCSHC
jgi:alpha-ribazole phosphatase